MKILIEAGADVNMGTGMVINDIGMSYYECKRTALMWLFHPESLVYRHKDSTFYHLTEEDCNALSQIQTVKSALIYCLKQELM